MQQAIQTGKDRQAQAQERQQKRRRLVGDAHQVGVQVAVGEPDQPPGQGDKEEAGQEPDRQRGNAKQPPADADHSAAQRPGEDGDEGQASQPAQHQRPALAVLDHDAGQEVEEYPVGL